MGHIRTFIHICVRTFVTGTAGLTKGVVFHEGDLSKGIPLHVYNKYQGHQSFFIISGIHHSQLDFCSTYIQHTFTESLEFIPCMQSFTVRDFFLVTVKFLLKDHP